MKVAVIGSRTLYIENLGEYLPNGVDEIVSGGAAGVDDSARHYARVNGIKLTEFLPDYRQYGRGAPLKRNLEIIDYADVIIAFWDGESKGTKHVIENARKSGKQIEIHTFPYRDGIMM